MKVDIQEKICLNELLQDAKAVAITGHVRPDGDCVGACLGLKNALEHLFPSLKAEVFLEPIPERFLFLKGASSIHTEPSDQDFDVVFALDCNVASRLGRHAGLLENAKKTVCIDHHISNGPFTDLDYIESEASSASELVCLLIGTGNLPFASCEALYMGIAHDTGIFQYSCTSSRTMRIAGELMDQGIDYPHIVAKTYYEKTYYQKQIMGRALLESVRMLDGKVIFSAIRRKEMDFFCVEPADLDGIVSELRSVEGVEVAIFLYETAPSQFKVSLRSAGRVNVNAVASRFGGGGHKLASGCEMQGSVHDVINNLTEWIAVQL